MVSLLDKLARHVVGPSLSTFLGTAGVIVKPPGAYPIMLQKAIVHQQEMRTDVSAQTDQEYSMHVVKVEFMRQEVEDRLLPLTNRTTVEIPEHGAPDFVVRAEESNLTSSLCTLVCERRLLQRRHENRRDGAA